MVNIIRDSSRAYEHPKVRAWLDRHPRFLFQVTPISCSWPNTLKLYSPSLPSADRKRRIFGSIIDLRAAVNRFIAEADKITAAANEGTTCYGRCIRK